MRYLIAGAGAAGAACAAKLAGLAEPGARIVVLEAAPSPPPSPALMPEYAAGEIEGGVKGEVGGGALEQAASWCKTVAALVPGAAAARLELRTSSGVAAVDPGRGAAVLETGEEIAFDRLLVATGTGSGWGRRGAPAGAAAPYRPLSVPGVFELRSWPDAERLHHALGTLKPGAAVAVIGGGPTGLRTAASLHNRGFRVTLVEALPYLLGQLGSEQAGSTLAGAACAAGIRVVTGAPVKSASHDAGGHVEGIACATPTGGDLTVDCSLAVVCTGVSGILPAGLHTSAAGTKHGFIPVDETMRTTHPNVWAAGDVALPPGWSRPPGLWRVAAWQGRQAALTMAGRPPGPVLDRVDLTLRFLDVFVWASRPYAAAAGQAVADGQYGSDGAGALPGWRVEIGPPGAVAEPTRDFRLEVAAGAD